MEEITIRFEIVRLAVKMADHETVQIQAKKLREISLDEDLNEIIGLLENRNYRQGLYLMKGYMSSLDDSFFNTPPIEKPKKPKKPEPQQDAQNLFDMMQPQTNKMINLDDMLRMTAESASETIAYENPETISENYLTETKEKVQMNDAYLDLHKNRVENKTIVQEMPNHLESTETLYNPLDDQIEILEKTQDDLIYSEPEANEGVLERSNQEKVLDVKTTEHTLETTVPLSEIVMDTETDAIIESSESVIKSELFIEPEVSLVEESIAETKIFPLEEEKDIQEVLTEVESISTVDEGIEDKKIDTDDTVNNNNLSLIKTETEDNDVVKETLSSEEIAVKEIDIALTRPDNSEMAAEDNKGEKERLEVKSREDYTQDQRRYPPISYIDQKFRNMRHQFPQVEPITEISHDVTLLLKQMATKGYTENDVKETIAEFQKKKSSGEKAEAAQLLLIAAASESKYAQLLLARELFKGEVLIADYPESFTQINRLAEHDYPEAICDLAQLYEYGYGIKKDKKTATLLYEEAAQMGVSRAQKHVERLTSKKGLLSLFKR